MSSLTLAFCLLKVPVNLDDFLLPDFSVPDGSFVWNKFTWVHCHEINIFSYVKMSSPVIPSFSLLACVQNINSVGKNLVRSLNG